MAGIPRWLPNAISAVRVVLVPAWVLCAEACRGAFLAGDHDAAATWRYAAAAVLVTIGVSDVVDGFLARRFGLTSRAGTTLDAVADKLAQVALLVFFWLRGEPAFPAAPTWFAAVILGRDVLLGTGWLLVRRRAGRVNVEHRFHGKLASVLLFVLLLLWTTGAGGGVSRTLAWTIAAIVVLSTAAYARAGWQQLRAPSPPGDPAPRA